MSIAFFSTAAMPKLNHKTVCSNSTLIPQITSKISDGLDLCLDDLEALKQFLSSDGASQLPQLDRNLLKRQSDGIQIVRHIGMVQNMLDPEFYVSHVNGRSFHFRDCNPASISENEDPIIEDYSNLAERQPLFVVPIPFTADWFNERQATTEELYNQSATTGEAEMATTSRKRDREAKHSKNSKHRSDEVEPDSTDMSGGILNPPEPTKSLEEWWPSGCKESDTRSSPVLMKLYYDQYSNADKKYTNLRLNDIVETIGVLSINPWEADFSTSDDFALDVTPPPPSRLPRLHVLAYRTRNLDDLAYEKVLSTQEATCESVEASVSSVLKNSVAAQAIFMTILSKAERKENAINRMSSAAIGAASLRVSTNIDTKYLFRRLRDVLLQSCPVVAALDLTSNEQHPFPVRSKGTIVPTSWQLPAGSTLLLHLGDLKQERLEELLTSHQLSYTFEGGMQLSFEADYRIVVISNNRQIHCSFEVCCDGEDLSRIEDEGSRLRQELARCRKIGNIKFSPEVLERARDFFLAQRLTARRANSKARMPSEDDFHRWLCLTRLQARANRRQEATTEDWEQALTLDDGIWNSLN